MMARTTKSSMSVKPWRPFMASSAKVRARFPPYYVFENRHTELAGHHSGLQGPLPDGRVRLSPCGSSAACPSNGYFPGQTNHPPQQGLPVAAGQKTTLRPVGPE